ncbi:secretin N-terminal domain-containing protein [Halopseudomonas oceani]|uniref:secretin N-terminal domain-containing protein n=1 Tax=Halopseudomonas oceani TaxID=1708783 RepID=UPI002AA6B2F0|nr:secretin N-terminal domain-containing protein [Halopseudomonas oceani]
MKDRAFAALLASMLWLVTITSQAAPTTEIVPLGYNMAENLIPALQPMLQSNERVSAYGNQLLIRAEPHRLSEIKQLIAQLDKQPSRLLISVANTGSSSGIEQGYRVDGRVDTGPVDIIVGQPRHDGNTARIINRRTTGANDGVRQITANEGYPVLIQGGQSVPITTTTTNIYGQVVQQTQYQDVTEGFYATVRLNGDLATITISANNNRLNSEHRNVIDVQQADTVVTARLGEWVSIGGINNTSRDNSGDVGRSISTQRNDTTSLRLKVDRLD